MNDLTFEVEASQENLKALQNLCEHFGEASKPVMAALAKMHEEGLEEVDDELNEDMCDFIRPYIDAMLGEGAFDQMYERMPNTRAEGMLEVLTRLIGEMPDLMIKHLNG